MALIRYVTEAEAAADKERRRRVAIEALKSTGAKRVYYEEPDGEAPPAVKRERRARVDVPAPAKTAETRFDRKAYQREYMRTYLPKWRGRRKGAGNERAER